ncbi:hypothetical protein LTS08_004380 [Lithohypha guttulata]|uniref:pH-response regulator protein palC n=1 Tax=Lithohypha guttulata TaxID=1690604 RepID=A0AAN7YB44_9EURO|nr:hypothetical protein LTR05_003478 [Lithohypha guttulata]KAK5101921.1 hypothetical protein LTS08_004380 [Lithohypha guttulata]
MPFPFVLSTTSQLSFQQNFTSSTHPSLPSTASSQRNLLRSTLKAHKRLASGDQAANLSDVLLALDSYLKYICTLNLSLSGTIVNDEDVDLALTREVEVEWRPTLSSTPIPGREADRVRGQGLDYEFFFVHQTYAVVQNLFARQALLGIYASSSPTTEQRLGLIQTAIRHVKTAASIHAFLVHHANTGDGPPELPAAAADVSISVQSALHRLAQAELNLLGAFKDDPYPAVLAQSRNEQDREWMIKAPDIPKTRAQVLSRLCLGASEHATAAGAILKAERRVSKDLIEYTDNLRRTARARACRFQAISADTGGETGKGIAWIYAGLSELGLEISVKEGSSKTGSLSKLKASWNERKEDRRIGKGSARWGSDAGKAEEARILEYLEKKLVRSNDNVHFQTVPEYKPLLAMLPSGMNMPVGDEQWKPPVLSEDELVQMRAPPDYDAMEQDSSDEDRNDAQFKAEKPAGAFPGTDAEYKISYY